MFKLSKKKSTAAVLLFILLCALIYSVSYGFECYALSPQKDRGQKQFALLSSYTTGYSQSSENRKSNIMLAAKKLNNLLLEKDAEFSFNTVVGARTESNGFKQAKIIFSGRFVDGVGGGVCQVSTTLYNAAIRAGLVISEYHPHTLLVGYTLPSTDAMVNSVGSDLKFINNTNGRIFLKTFATNDKITISIYGLDSGYKWAVESSIDECVPSQEVVRIKDTEKIYPDLFIGEEKVISYGASGARSKSYLLCYKQGKLIYKKLLRTDYYAPSVTVIMEGTVERSCNGENQG